MEGRTGPSASGPDVRAGDPSRRGDPATGAPAAGGMENMNALVPPLPAALARADEAPFVGRADALRQLQDRWQDHARAAGGLVILTGEPGIGKTRLAARLAVEVHTGGGVVLCGRADEENVWPYQAFVEALRHYAVQRPGGGAGPRAAAPAARAVAALIRELGAPAAAQPPGRGDEHDRNRHHLCEAV